MKSLWSGSIAFGLVTIDIDLVTAIKEHSLGFKNVCAVCHTPLEYIRYCPHCKKEVAWSGVAKGIKVDGVFKVISQQEIKRLKPEKSESIRIHEFVDESLISPLLYRNHFYVLPRSSEAYFLLRKALLAMSKVAIGTFVMRDKEYVCSIEPYEEGMILNTLYYAHEVRDFPAITQKQEAHFTAAELSLAKKLISGLVSKKFSIERYKDTFAAELKKALKATKKKKSTPKKEKETRKKRTVSSIAAQLRESLRPSSRPVARAKSKR